MRMGHHGQQGDGPEGGRYQDDAAFLGLSRWEGNVGIVWDWEPEGKAGFRGRK